MRDAAPSLIKIPHGIGVKDYFRTSKQCQLMETLLKLAPKVKNKPLLLIDDECDQASVDTNPDHSVISGEEANPEHDPTKTNKLIRRILKAYDKSSYVGYTDTPYSNAFIPMI